MNKQTPSYVMHYLGNHGLELNDLIAGRIRTNRKLCIAIIKDGLAWVRISIFEHKSYWDYDVVKKLEELETGLAALETSEKNKPQRTPPPALTLP
jgi:hypothetical protein